MQTVKTQKMEVCSFQENFGRRPLVAIATLILLSLQMKVQWCVGFSSGSNHLLHKPKFTRTRTTTSDASAEDDKAVDAFSRLTGALADAECREFILKYHKPLGCSVEESLAYEPDGAKYVFVAQVRENAFYWYNICTYSKMIQQRSS